MKHPVIALWSHPRSMSTAMERIMRSRGDLACLHEPFMYDYYINRSTKQMPHFNASDEHPKTYEAIRAMILARAEHGPVFFKDMSYYVVPHILQDTEFLDRVTHSFLIREPRASILSYAKLDPGLSLEEVGLESQWRLFDALQARGGTPPAVVRSEAVQADSRGEMHKYWAALGLSDKPQALIWDGAAPADWQQVQGWHGEVIASTTIKPPRTGQAERTDAEFAALVETSPHLAAYLKHHAPFYEQLLRFAL
jgi:hypothetical protein